MNIVFFILLLILLILIIPIKVKVDFNYNVLRNRGHIKLKVFNFKLFYYKLKYADKKIVLSNFKTTKEINMEINKQNIDFANELQKQIRKRLYLKELKFYLNVGVNENPFASAMLSAGCEVLLSTISSLIKFQKPTAKVNYEVSNYYTKDMAVISVDFDVSISITNLLLSLLKTKRMSKKKELEYNGRKSKTSNRGRNNGYIKKY